MTAAPTKQKPLVDPAEVLRTLRLLKEPGEVFEIRILDATTLDDRWERNWFGYFDDPAKVPQELKRIKSAVGIYHTMNPVDPALLGRACNRLKKAKTGDATGDGQIIRRRWLLIDADAERPSGTSATDEQHEAALELGRRVYKHLHGLGWSDPIVASSGNGCHLLYRIDLPTNDRGIVERCLKVLAARFNGNSVKIDDSVHNPSRIVRLYGTLAAKGDSTLDRPHRESNVLKALEQ